MNPSKSHCGLIALLGPPNAGKSTLINRIVNSKVSIVSHKAQTTRTRVCGIVSEGQTQIILFDTPGIFRPKRLADQPIIEVAWRGAKDADLLVLVVDAHLGFDENTMQIIHGLNKINRNTVLALNKVDNIKREKLLPLAAQLNEVFKFEKIFMISALTGSGCKDLKIYLSTRIPSGPWLYTENELSNIPMRLMAAEITREKIFLHLHKELPYSIIVKTDRWTERDDGSIKIDQVLYVKRNNHKKITLGKGGKNIKHISFLARNELEKMLEHRVHLFLFIKVRKKMSRKLSKPVLV
ncbi:GTP-binding protein Era [Candidatus Endolissoclinum faulkneri L5]|uniref:GTPase Era n=1 Tax=Candidatus Endolissoclinum faulkneri L5 TaxID=1401328 RepID=V9TTN5_9PROT|nr:GTPase Era [Candidatus Endolissoclinum faulkneri]AHC73966.1 GTP-binding protein Era [Candidatus Endolissoclinum faulkneri L5]